LVIRVAPSVAFAPGSPPTLKRGRTDGSVMGHVDGDDVEWDETERDEMHVRRKELGTATDWAVRSTHSQRARRRGRTTTTR